MTRQTVVTLDFPFQGTWKVENSPARRVPSHGTYAFGTSHAIDFVAVDDAGLSAPRNWRTLVAAEPPGIFAGFGQPVLAPLSGRVVAVHDGEPDHEGRRSPVALGPEHAPGASGPAGGHRRARRSMRQLGQQHRTPCTRPGL
ncbi:hypothetical protein [Arthrobacter castelli]|uniref:hypothetical protein n=1 Tax=Arthrobacter castelli TaxID=271431 RepID=UPI001FDEE1EF|nr:hypothetical protein [Arthrobacter castelli]